MDIVVTLPKHWGIEHLQEKIDDIGPYWEMENQNPTKLKKGDRVFIVFDGIVRGSFLVKNLEFVGNFCMIDFQGGSYQAIKPIKMKGFRSFRYRKFEYEEMN